MNRTQDPRPLNARPREDLPSDFERARSLGLEGHAAVLGAGIISDEPAHVRGSQDTIYNALSLPDRDYRPQAETALVQILSQGVTAEVEGMLELAHRLPRTFAPFVERAADIRAAALPHAPDQEIEQNLVGLLRDSARAMRNGLPDELAKALDTHFTIDQRHAAAEVINTASSENRTAAGLFLERLLDPGFQPIREATTGLEVRQNASYVRALGYAYALLGETPEGISALLDTARTGLGMYPAIAGDERAELAALKPVHLIRGIATGMGRANLDQMRFGVADLLTLLDGAQSPLGAHARQALERIAEDIAGPS